MVERRELGIGDGVEHGVDGVGAIDGIGIGWQSAHAGTVCVYVVGVMLDGEIGIGRWYGEGIAVERATGGSNNRVGAGRGSERDGEDSTGQGGTGSGCTLCTTGDRDETDTSGTGGVSFSDDSTRGTAEEVFSDVTGTGSELEDVSMLGQFLDI